MSRTVARPAETLPTTENEIDASQHELELTLRQMTDAPPEQRPIEAVDLRDVRDRFLWQTGRRCSEEDVPRGLRMTQVARENDAHDGRDTTSVECISLDDDDRASKARA
jgi:hypothetical protein